ncbi:PP2C family protein-serine/threonine phosphatase [Actinokineospora bangkokensis]|uniref:Diguanylate phosphodiesterase n=1 Tax=Actinokineospora bangkokensis TaxID=1193682 RepID=A0A1Q9LNI7_9PSEU|nr:GAF domain-containing SpoIIE family protein phosphatase [Actinokineospora bangkokensis]OLR93616.1 diguanylate phosphodiesterase [Actinokineospora bangkokensis]
MPETTGPRGDVLDAVIELAIDHADLEDYLRAVLTEVAGGLGVDTASVLLRDPGHQALRVRAAVGIEQEVSQGVTVPIGAGFAGRVAERRSPVVLHQVDQTTVVNPLLWRSGLRVLAGVPLVARDELVGVLHVGARTPREFSGAEVDLLASVADRMALVVQAEVSQAQLAAATLLQQSLLPSSFPPVAGFTFDARYVPGTGSAVGGDWYDVFTLPGGRLGLAIGDVAGHGLPSAVVMGRLRSALRAYALEHDDPAEVLTRLARKSSHFEPNAMATVIYGVVDIGTARLALSCAGHLPPVLAVPGEPATLLPVPTDLPIGLGLQADRRRRALVVDLPDQAVLAFCTDGLVERRTEPLDLGLAALTGAVEHGPPAAVCANVMDTLIGAQPHGDDVALLVVGHDRTPATP